jgi:nucleoside phosphorylase
MPERAKADVAILVALQEEYEVLAPVMSKDIEPVDGRYWFTFADVNGKTRSAVISVLGNMGNEESRVAADRLITAVQPSLVASIGIAGILSDRARLGEVVVATEVDNYHEKGKLIDDADGIGLAWGGRTLLASTLLASTHPTRLASSFRTAREPLFENWKKSVLAYMNEVIPAAAQKDLAEAGLLPPKSLLHVGPIASGPVVGMSKDFKDLLRERNRNFVALEMESAGGLAAAYDRELWPTTLVIRGLADPSDERKALLDKLGSGVVRRWAMYNASTLLSLFLRQLPIWADDAESSRRQIHQRISAVHLEGPYRERPSDDMLERMTAYFRIVTRSDALPLDKGSYWATLSDHVLKSGDPYPLRIDGEPGTGKTTLLSALYWYLYAMAERDRSVPLPVLVNVQHFDDLAYDDDGKRRPEMAYAEAIRIELSLLIRYAQSGNPVVMLIAGVDADARFRSSAEEVLFEVGISSVKKIVSVAPGLTNTGGLPPEWEDPETVVTLLPVRADSDECESVVVAFAAMSGVAPNITNARLNGLGIDSVDLATLSMVQRTMDRIFKKSKTLSDVYITWCESERSRSKAGGTLLGTAEMAYAYTFKHRPFDGSKKAAAADWKLIRSHSNVRHCLIAWLIVQCLTDDESGIPQQQRLDVLDHIYAFSINRFCKELLNKNFRTQEHALKGIMKLFPSASVTLRTSLAYIVGRFENVAIREGAAKFLRDWMGKLTPETTTTRQELMLVRTCFVSLAKLGDTEATSRYVSFMLKNSDLDDLNRGFHLEYYGDVEYYEVSLNDEYRDHLGPFPKTGDRLTQKIEEALENGSGYSLEIEVFTLCSLAHHRKAQGSLSEEDRLKILNLIRRIDSSDLVETSELRAYLQRVGKELSDTPQSPQHLAELLSAIVFKDPTRLNLLAAPSTAEFVEALLKQQAESPKQVADFIGRVLLDSAGFKPNPLWLAWIIHLHGDQLAQIGSELHRRTRSAAPGLA